MLKLYTKESETYRRRYTNGYISRVAGLLAVLVGLSVLAGWELNIPALKSVLPGLVSMKFNTALCFILSGIALFLINRDKNSRFNKEIIIICACIVLLTGMLTLSEYIFSYNAGIDELLRNEGLGTIATVFPGRMSQISALNFILCGTILMLLRKEKYKMVILAMFLVILTLSLLTLFVYLFGINFSVPMINATAVHTAGLFVLLSAGFVYSSTITKTRLNFQKEIVAVFILVAILLGMMFYIYDKNQERSVGTTKLVEHTYDVLSKAEKLKVHANETENVIKTFNPAALEPKPGAFNNERDSMQAIIADLKKMTVDNGVQQTRLHALESLIHSYGSEDMKPAEIRPDLFPAGKAALMISTVQAKILEIIQTENGLLVKRKAENEKIIRNASRIITLLQIITFLLLLAGVIVIYNNTRHRNKIEEENQRLNSTLEKRVEEKTREALKNEQQYRFLLQNMHEGIQIIGYDWRYLFVNNSVVEQAMYSAEELEGYTMMEKYPGIEHTELFKVLRKCMTERVSETMENEFTFPDQSKGYFELSIQPVPEGIFILSIDITNRKRAEEKLKNYAEELQRSDIERKITTEKLRQSNERYEYVNKATQDTIWEWDFNNNEGRWGEGIISTFGYPENKLSYGYDWISEFVHPEDREYLTERIDGFMKTGLKNWQSEYRFRCADGSYKEVLDRGYILFDEQKNPYRMIGAMTDITEKKRMETELAEQQLMQQKIITETTIQAQEKERNELGKELHDNINQILATVKMYLGMIKAGNDLPESLIGKSYDHVNDAMEEIRKLSHSLVAPSLRHTGLKVCLEELSGEINLLKGIHVQLEYEENPGLMPDEKTELMLYRIVQEQLNNIQKYAKAENVIISIKAVDATLLLTITDNGIGFDTSATTKGIGLKNIRNRVNFYSGDLEILSSPGEGCTLKIRVPFINAQANKV